MSANPSSRPQPAQPPAWPAQLVKLSGMVVKTGVSPGQLSDSERRLALALPAWRLPVGVSVAESDVNELLRQSLGAEAAFLRTDHVELRRWLVDIGWWRRDGYGRAYARPALEELPPDLRLIAQALSTVEPAAWARQQVDIYRAAQRERRARWTAAAEVPQASRGAMAPQAANLASTTPASPDRADELD